MAWVQDTTIAFEAETEEIAISPLIPILGAGLLLIILLTGKK